MIQFLRNSTRLDEAGSHNALPISSSLLRPKFSVAVYRATDFQPKQFFHAIADTQHVAAAWLNERSGTLYYVTRSESSVQWSRSKELRDRQWDLYIVHHDAARELVYIHSSDKSTLHEALAMAVTNNTATLVSGDQVFRAMGHIARLKFQNIGVKKHGRAISATRCTQEQMLPRHFQFHREPAQLRRTCPERDFVTESRSPLVARTKAAYGQKIKVRFVSSFHGVRRSGSCC